MLFGFRDRSAARQLPSKLEHVLWAKAATCHYLDQKVTGLTHVNLAIEGRTLIVEVYSHKARMIASESRHQASVARRSATLNFHVGLLALRDTVNVLSTTVA